MNTKQLMMILLAVRVHDRRKSRGADCEAHQVIDAEKEPINHLR